MKLQKILSCMLSAIMIIGIMLTGVTVGAEEELPFTDVKKNWAYESIKYVTENKLMNGTGGDKFSPGDSLTRAMVVTVLYRMEGSPKVSFYDGAFTDVKAGTFYSNAAVWALENGVVTGTSVDDWGTPAFSPTRAITRQELATMFVRYAEYRFVKTEKIADISGYKDIGDVAKWASKAMAWCNEVGLIKGTGSGDTLSPKMTATREQFATLIYRFNEEAALDYFYLLNEPKPLSKFTEPKYELVPDADIYVAVDGSDSAPGTLEKPIATFERAVQMVRELKKNANDEIVVAFKAGNYGNLQLELTDADAGTAEAPIVYTCYGDGDVIFSNGINVSIDEFKPIDEGDYKFFPEKNRGKIMKVDMSAKDTNGELNALSPLFSNSERIEMARFPNKSSSGKDELVNIVDSFETIISGISSFNGVDPNTEYGDYGRWSCKLTQMGSRHFDTYHTYENIVAIGKAGADYDGDYITVDSYDRDTDTLVFTVHDWIDSFGAFGGVKLIYMNISEELDVQGEYWYDPDGKTLYVYDPNYKNYTLGTKGTFVKMNGADHVSFVGLDFCCSTDDAIQAEADNVRFDDCKVFGTAGRTPAVIINGYNNAFVNSELSNLSAGGIVVGGGDLDRIIPSNSVIDNNLLHDFGQIYHSWPHVTGIFINGGVGVTVSHNEIYNSPHMAIMFASLWGRSIDCIIEYNYIHEVVDLCYGDLGAIYCGRLHTDRDNIVRYNIVANVSAGHGSAWGVYVDDGMSGQQFYANLFYAPDGYAFLHSGGRDNVIKDNFIIGNPTGLGQPLRIWAKWAEMLKADGSVTSGNWHHMLQFINAYLPTDPDVLKLWKDRWPELFDALEGPECVPENLDEYNMLANSAGCVFKNNYSFGYSTEHWVLDPNDNKFNVFENNPIWGRDALKGEGDAPHVFVNPAIGDYSIRDDAELELEDSYDFSKIGRY